MIVDWQHPPDNCWKFRKHNLEHNRKVFHWLDPQRRHLHPELLQLQQTGRKRRMLSSKWWEPGRCLSGLLKLDPGNFNSNLTCKTPHRHTPLSLQKCLHLLGFQSLTGRKSQTPGKSRSPYPPNGGNLGPNSLQKLYLNFLKILLTFVFRSYLL